jgi:hypothetical protein
MLADYEGYFPWLILLGIVVISCMVTGAIKAHNTASELGSTGWELAGYTASGLIFSDYLPIKNNWNTIYQNIKPGYKDGIIDFNFTENRYYSIYTAGLYSDYLYENCPVEGRTKTGMYIELQVHYVAYKVGIENGNPAMLGVPDFNGDWTAAISEVLAFCLNRRPIAPNPLPR